MLCVQPLAGSQKSLVQIWLSSQPTPAPGLHLLSAQASPVVHALPSEHVTAFAKCTQPTPSAQLSSVHKLPSSQFGALPLQAPWRHASFTLHA